MDKLLKLKNTQIFLFIFITLGILSFGSGVRASGGDDTTIVPDQFRGLLDNIGFEGLGLTNFVSDRVSDLLGYGALTLVLISSGYLFIAAYNYFKSRGNQAEIEKAANSVMYLLRGFVMLFVASAGTLVIFLLFGIPFLPTDIYQTCIVEPTSLGCRACEGDAGGIADEDDEYRTYVRNTGSNIVPIGVLSTALTNMENGDGADIFTYSSPAAGGASITMSFNQTMCSFCEYEFYHKSLTNVFTAPAAVQTYCQDL